MGVLLVMLLFLMILFVLLFYYWASAAIRQKKIIILCAFDPEYRNLFSIFDRVKKERVEEGRKLVEGFVSSRPVILIQTGIGLINTAYATQYIIDREGKENISAILFVGVAGAIHPLLTSGDVSIPERWAQYDNQVWLSPGQKLPDSIVGVPVISRGYHSYPSCKVACQEDNSSPNRSIRPTYTLDNNGDVEYKYWFPVDPHLFAKTNVLTKFPYVRRGGIGISGSIFQADRFFTSYIQTIYNNVRIVDEESVAAAQVCFYQQVPFLAIRLVSDVQTSITKLLPKDDLEFSLEDLPISRLPEVIRSFVSAI